MKEKFRDVRLSADNKKRLEQINSIIEEYQAQGYRLTLRQLYYQLVSRDFIPNLTAEYNKLSRILTEGRMGGIVDWDAIEDRIRVPYKPNAWDSPKQILNAAMRQYRRDRMEGQEVYIEVWVEKDALSGVLKRVTENYGITILVNRGYSSVSSMYDSFKRIEAQIMDDKTAHILYLGDFDPSGLDMIRDIESRISEFLRSSSDLDNYAYDQDLSVNEAISEKFNVCPIALTRQQINLYNPPPNVAKITDSRADKFIQEHGSYSWEVDALKPEVLNRILEDAILERIDESLLRPIDEKQAEEVAKIKNLIRDFE